MISNSFSSLSNAALLDATRALVSHTNVLEADLLAHLGEVEERRLHLEHAFPSMFEFCTEELGMSEGVAFNRIYVARLARRLPVVLEWVRSGRIHLSGLRVLAPHLTSDNCASLLAEAAGKSKRGIQELVTRFAPKPPVPTSMRKLPSHARAASTAAVSTSADSRLAAQASASDHGMQGASTTPDVPLAAAADSTDTGFAELLVAPEPHAPRRPEVEPLAPDTFKLTLTIDGALREKVKQALDLMRHRVPDGDFGPILEEALDLLIEKVKKERFGVGRTPRSTVPTDAEPAASRHIPDAIKRAVYERDGGRCSFVSEDGRRCAETAGLEFDHLEGFAITGTHSVERIALRCHAHNHFAAEKLYGRAKMARMKKSVFVTCPGTGEQKLLL